MSELDFGQVFKAATGFEPFGYQCRLACGDGADPEKVESLDRGSICQSKLINIPTGLGKTAAVILAWLWNRVLIPDETHREKWPRRLVYCLPMRTLVEQTRDEASKWLDKFSLLWDGEGDHPNKVGLHVLMGGEEKTDWDIYPEYNAVLIGTQDMLLSRALNRGYGMSRYRWPMHFGLLNNDCLWVMDETQLMGPGLWTSAQLDWMRRDRFPPLLPSVTWWMSATISPDFLDTIDRRNAGLEAPKPLTLGDEPAAEKLLNARRPCWIWKQSVGAHRGGKRAAKKAQPENLEAPFAAALAGAVVQEHAPGTLSLVVCNTVRFAQTLFEIIAQRRAQSGDAILLTSRFRPMDRESNAERLIAFEKARKAGEPHSGLICVSTQVVEAGVDVSARRLWSEVGPWPSMLQRLGRLNRDGCINDEALAHFFEVPAASMSRKRAAQPVGPYDAKDIADGKKLITGLSEISVKEPKASFREMRTRLESEAAFATIIAAALRAKLEPFPRAMDLHGLFTNEPDAFGGFTDISRFVRGEDRNADARVFWRTWNPETDDLADSDGPAFSREEGCPVPIHRVREFLGEKGRGWLWNSKAEQWEPARADGLVPGMLIMLPAAAGGYDRGLGWTGRKTDSAGLEDAPPPGPAEERATDDQAIGCWVDLETHLRDVEKEAQCIVQVFPSDSLFRNAIVTAARYHDIGKSIPQWQQALPQPPPRPNVFWAKAPFLLRIEAEPRRAVSRVAVEQILQAAQIPFRWTDAEQPGRKRDPHRGELHFHLGRKPNAEAADALGKVAGVSRVVVARFRPGLRHEAVSALALWRRFYYDNGTNFPALTLYAVAAHHGIVRSSLGSRDQAEPNVCGIPLSVLQIPWDGGMQLDFDCASDGAAGDFSEDGSTFTFHAPSWSGLVTDLLGGWEKDAPRAPSGAVRDGEPCHLGPFGLAYLEALLRAADGRASKSPSLFISPTGQSS